MFVFAETRSAAEAHGAPPPPPVYELQGGALKEQLPFEELVVVAGLQGAHTGAATQSPPLRQLTCLSARVKPWGRRVLLVLPIPVAADDKDALVQILDVGEVAATFAHEVRGCFPTLARRSPISYATPDSDDESGDDDDGDDAESEESDDTRAKKRKRVEVQQREDQKQQLLKAEQQRAANGFMDKTRAKMLQSLDELFHAFAIQNQAQVRVALLHEGEGCQWLCVDLPALTPPPSSEQNAGGGSAATGVAPHNFGLMFSHAASTSASLAIPMPRPPRGFFAQIANASNDEDDGNAEVFQDATVLSLGARREATTHGGGKTPEETVKNIRMRHASGTFCTLVSAETTWEAVVTKYAALIPQVREIQGELRLRRIMGPARNVPVTLLLERSSTGRS